MSKNHLTKFLFCVAVIFIPTILRATTYTVTTAADIGVGSLREAITSANSHAGADTIAFHLLPSDPAYNLTTGVWTITVATELPYVTGSNTFINGASQSTYGNNNPYGPEVFINGNDVINTGIILASLNNKVRCLGITGFVYGILIYGTTGNTITEV